MRFFSWFSNISFSFRTRSSFNWRALLITLVFNVLKLLPLLNLCLNTFFSALLNRPELFMILFMSFRCSRFCSFLYSASAFIFSSSSRFFLFFERLRAFCITLSFNVLKLLPASRRCINSRLSSFVKFFELLRIFCNNFFWSAFLNDISPWLRAFFIFFISSSTFFFTVLKFLVFSKFRKNLAFMELLRFLELFSKTLNSLSFKS